jgi:hypothetical protein
MAFFGSNIVANAIGGGVIGGALGYANTGDTGGILGGVAAGAAFGGLGGGKLGNWAGSKMPGLANRGFYNAARGFNYLAGKAAEKGTNLGFEAAMWGKGVSSRMLGRSIHYSQGVNKWGSRAATAAGLGASAYIGSSLIGSNRGY